MLDKLGFYIVKEGRQGRGRMPQTTCSALFLAPQRGSQGPPHKDPKAAGRGASRPVTDLPPSHWAMRSECWVPGKWGVKFSRKHPSMPQTQRPVTSTAERRANTHLLCLLLQLWHSRKQEARGGLLLTLAVTHTPTPCPVLRQLNLFILSVLWHRLAPGHRSQLEAVACVSCGFPQSTWHSQPKNTAHSCTLTSCFGILLLG